VPEAERLIHERPQEGPAQAEPGRRPDVAHERPVGARGSSCHRLPGRPGCGDRRAAVHSVRRRDWCLCGGGHDSFLRREAELYGQPRARRSLRHRRCSANRSVEGRGVLRDLPAAGACGKPRGRDAYPSRMCGRRARPTLAGCSPRRPPTAPTHAPTRCCLAHRTATHGPTSRSEGRCRSLSRLPGSQSPGASAGTARAASAAIAACADHVA
jgi:hypothetical protein